MTRTPGAYRPGMFCGVASAADFARVLEVPVRALDLVVPEDKVCCRAKDCRHNAIRGNHGFCPAHCRSWYPLLGERGGDLLGSEFLRSAGNFRTCDCQQTVCRSAGYFPGQSALSVPAAGVETVLKTPNLISSKVREEVLSSKHKRIYLYPWHFFPEHRSRDGGDGKWKINFNRSEKKTFYDLERNPYDFPPPRYSVRRYVEDEHFAASYVRPQDRWAIEGNTSDMPSWMGSMLAIDGDAASSGETSARSIGEWIQQAKNWRARAMFLKKQKEDECERSENILAGTKRKYEAIIDRQSSRIQELEANNGELRKMLEAKERDLQRLRDELADARRRKGQPLRYSDLRSPGLLADRVEHFTFFNTVEQNDAWLELINFADGSEGSFPRGDGLCENLRVYSKVTMQERMGEEPPPSIEPDSDRYKSYLNGRKAKFSKSDMTWKDDYLMWSIYTRGGVSQEFAAGLFGVSSGRMSDVFHEWSNVMDAALKEMFPMPTRSQMLRAFPSRFIEADGHARNYLLLDAFEVFTQQSSNVNVASSTHSDYKGHCTVKFLGAVDPIGCPWAGTVPDGNPGRLSDVLATMDSKILRQVPFGGTAKADKAFIVDNEAAKEGVVIDRPQKRLKKQIQQTSVDTSQTQKVGNTRIIVENVNGGLRLSMRYLNVLIPCNQFGIISKVVRVGYLLQNFKKAIIQNKDHNPQDAKRNRPCRAEIRWYGATDAGLVDVRGNIRLWGLTCEIDRHEQLSAMDEHKGKTPTEISEIVLAERWDIKMRKQLYEEVRGIHYEEMNI